MDKKTLGKRLRLQRQGSGLTLKDLAGFTGLSISYLSDIERGRTFPSLKALDKISKSYEMEMWEFLAPEGVVISYRLSQIKGVMVERGKDE